MTDLSNASPPGQDAHRLAMRLSVELLLRSVELRMAIGPGDLLDLLIEQTMVTINTTAIDASPDLARRYASYEDVPPDDLRIPVSIKTLAGVVHLPFETVRRRVKAMVQQGWCVQTRAGVYVPSAVLVGPERHVALAANYANVRRLHQTWRQLMPQTNLVQATPGLDDGAPALTAPVRLVSRLLSQFNLSLIGLVSGPQGDPVRAMILAAIIVANARNVSQSPDQAMRYAAGSTPVPDEERWPVSVSAVASSLRLPFETARRRVNHLIAQGLVVRGRNGVYIPAALVSSPAAQIGMAANFANLQNLYTRLWRAGVRFD